MNPFKGIISHYKWKCPDKKGFICIYTYLYTAVYALTLIWRYAYHHYFKLHSLTALIGWDWDQDSKEYSCV